MWARAAGVALILVICPELHASDEFLPSRIPDVPSASTEGIAQRIVYPMAYKQSEVQRTIFDPAAVRHELMNAFLEWPDGFLIPDNVFRHEWNASGMIQRTVSSVPYEICDGHDEVKLLQKSWRPPEILKGRRDCSYQRRMMGVFEDGEFQLDWIDARNFQRMQGLFSIFCGPNCGVGRTTGGNSGESRYAPQLFAGPPKSPGENGDDDGRRSRNVIMGKEAPQEGSATYDPFMEGGAGLIAGLIICGLILAYYKASGPL